MTCLLFTLLRIETESCSFMPVTPHYYCVVCVLYILSHHSLSLNKDLNFYEQCGVNVRFGVFLAPRGELRLDRDFLAHFPCFERSNCFLLNHSYWLRLPKHIGIPIISQDFTFCFSLG